jgi:quercetin dioxygenase-like cupin family protein
VTARPPATGGSSHSIHVLAGHVQVTTREGNHELKAGALLVLSPGVTHDLYAPIQSQVLLTVHLEPRDLSHPRHA